MRRNVPFTKLSIGLALAVFAGIGCGSNGQNSDAASTPSTETVPETSAPTATSTSPPSSPPSSPATQTPPAPQRLSPNMRSLPAEDIHILEGENGRELRFAAALANFGSGPLVLEPDDERPCPEGQRFASQVIYIDGNADGVFDPDADEQTETRPAGCMVFHPTHDHWHFDSSASYVLTNPGSDTALVSLNKVSFCMRDSRELQNADFVSPETYGECERDQIQGISAGWADVYSSDLDGQALDLEGISDGGYCLRLTSDPFDLLRETDDTDNSSAVAIDISGTEVTASQDASVCET